MEGLSIKFNNGTVLKRIPIFLTDAQVKNSSVCWDE
jgi:hypothetical protein